MKYKIEKNTVQETLILPLYSRKLCTELAATMGIDVTSPDFWRSSLKLIEAEVEDRKSVV